MEKFGREEGLEPAIDFCKESDNYHFIEVNGEQPIEKVYVEIMNFCRPLIAFE